MTEQEHIGTVAMGDSGVTEEMVDRFYAALPTTTAKPPRRHVVIALTAALSSRPAQEAVAIVSNEALEKEAYRLFQSLRSPFGHDAKTREEDVQRLADALKSVRTQPALGQEECAALVDEMLAQPSYSSHRRTKLALTVAAKAIRFGRHLNAFEKMENIRKFCEGESE